MSTSIAQRPSREMVESAMAIAIDNGLDDLARRLEATVTGSDRLPRVVCCGHQKAGKSRLVNALAGRPLLSPIGDDVVTATFLVVSPGDHDRAVAVLIDPDTRRARRQVIELSDIADYISVDAVHEGVIGAEVQLTSLRIAGVQFMDTPGVGGLSPSHNDVTMASLRSADALLFAISPGAPLSAPELAFLRGASELVENVVLVMTKIDLFPEWEAVRDADLELVARHVPRLAGHRIVSVSSLLVEEASRRRQQNPALAESLLAESGVESLIAELDTRVLGAGRATPLDGRTEFGRLLHELRAWVAGRSEHDGTEATDIAGLTAERDRIAAFLLDPHHGALDTHRRIDSLRRDARREFDDRVSGIFQRYSGAVGTVSRGELKKVPYRLQHEIASVFLDAVETVDREVGVILDGLEASIGSIAALAAVRVRLGQPSEPQITDFDSAPEYTTHLLPTSEVLVSSAWQLVGVVGGGVAAGPIGPFVIAVGAAAVVTMGLRQYVTSWDATSQQNVRLWLDRARREIELGFDNACGDRLDHVERTLRVALPGVLEARIARIEALQSVSDQPAGPSEADRIDTLIARARRAPVSAETAP